VAVQPLTKTEDLGDLVAGLANHHHLLGLVVRGLPVRDTLVGITQILDITATPAAAEAPELSDKTELFLRWRVAMAARVFLQASRAHLSQGLEEVVVGHTRPDPADLVEPAAVDEADGAQPQQ
jgi:hypothetical protein